MISFSKEQIFIVTGASSGIGEETAILLNKLGATVVGIGRNVERLEKMKAKCDFPENMFLEPKDLTEDIEGLPQYVKSLKEKYGKFSGMAYCAGITDVTPLKILDYTKSLDLFNIDYFAPIFMIKGITDKRNNIGSGTSIVAISSLAGISASRGMVSYCGAKAALINSIKAINKEIIQSGIRVNTISPSDIETPMTNQVDIKNFVMQRSSLYPLGYGKPDDVANMIIYLLSDNAKFISGQNYIIDSGGIL